MLAAAGLAGLLPDAGNLAVTQLSAEPVDTVAEVAGAVMLTAKWAVNLAGLLWTAATAVTAIGAHLPHRIRRPVGSLLCRREHLGPRVFLAAQYMILHWMDRGRPTALLRDLRPLPGDLAGQGPEINSSPLASPGTIASLFSLQGAHEIRVRRPRQFPC